MKSAYLLLPILLLCLVAWRVSEQAVSAAPPQATKAHMNMLQLMRAFPFPHSNVLFDTQSRDPVGKDKKESMS